MTVSEKNKTNDNKIEQNKAQYNLDRQTANISALSPSYVGKYEFLTGEDILPEKELLEETDTVKKFVCYSLDKEVKAQNDIAKYQYNLLRTKKK